MMKKHIVITGRSGSGKSISLHFLEDNGFYCVDNAPIGLLPALREELEHRHARLAVSIDARNIPSDLENYGLLIEQAQESGRDWEIIYVDANDDILLKRFSETRRKHPLTSPTVSLKEAMEHEKKLLEPIANIADLMIDTSTLTIHELRKVLQHRVAEPAGNALSILFESFGYKHGIPQDADYVFDVRCLPNPYWQPELRQLTGLDAPVSDYLKQQAIVKKMLKDIIHFLDHWIPAIQADNRRYITIAIGCTGGQHRSVYITEQLAKYYLKHHAYTQVRHRDIS